MTERELSEVEMFKQLEKELIGDGIILYMDPINKRKMYFNLRPGSQSNDKKKVDEYLRLFRALGGSAKVSRVMEYAV